MPVESIHLEALEPFYATALITDVLRPLKSGKEGTVYVCRAHPSTGREFLAAKIYRSLHQRTFRNDALYREGRFMGDARAGRALKKKSNFGREVQHGSWMQSEYEALARLRTAGADVPEVVAQSDSAILMQYVGDADQAAPNLRTAAIDPAEARPLFQRLVRNIELFLSCDLVHGDLSAYNVLYWQGTPTIIDFPQAVDPRFNPNALSLLERDFANVCLAFEPLGINANPALMAQDLWRRFLYAQL